MIQLVLMLFIGICFLCLAFYWLTRGSKASSDDYLASEAVLQSLLRLPSLEFDGAKLFSDADYRMLLSEPKLRSIARELRADRKDIAIEWLGELRKDIFSMWRFRAFLTRLGVTHGIHKEFQEALRPLLLLSFLSVVRVSVRFLGLYTLGEAAISVKAGVEKTKRSLAATLANLPRERWAQIADEWERAQATYTTIAS